MFGRGAGRWLGAEIVGVEIVVKIAGVEIAVKIAGRKWSDVGRAAVRETVAVGAGKLGKVLEWRDGRIDYLHGKDWDTGINGRRIWQEDISLMNVWCEVFGNGGR